MVRTDTWVTAGLGALAAVALTILAISLVGLELPYTVMVMLLAILLLAALVRELVVFRDPLTPGGIVAMTGLLLFVLRPLTILANGITSPGAIADSQFFSPSLMRAGSAGLAQTLAFFFAFYCVYVTFSTLADRAAARRGFPTQFHDLQPSVRLDGPKRIVNGTALQTILLAFCLVAVGALVSLIASAGGLSAYIAGIANRSDFLAGRSFLVLGYVPIQIALVLNVLRLRSEGLRVWNTANLIGLGALLLTGIAAGGRGPFVIGVILPLVLLKQLSPKPLKLRTLGVLGLAVIVIAVSYSIVIRNANYDQGRSFTQFRANPTAAILDQITSGAETRPFDSVIRLNDAVINDDDFQFQNGSTYATAPTWFIPRALWAEKPSGGGNTWFTSNYVPRFYGVNRVETSLSAVGEGYANFGFPGVLLAGSALGALGVALRRQQFPRRGLLGRTLIVSLSPLMFSIIRGDLYQGGSLTAASTILACGLYFVVSRPAVRGEHAALPRSAPHAEPRQSLPLR